MNNRSRHISLPDDDDLLESQRDAFDIGDEEHDSADAAELQLPYLDGDSAHVDLPQDLPKDLPKNIPKDLPQEHQEDLPQDIPQDLPQPPQLHSPPS